MMRSALEEELIRQDVFRWLDQKIATGASEVTRDELRNYTFGTENIPLVDTARGIRNPADFESTLSIMTSIKSPYADSFTSDGFVHYSYQSREGGDNKKLRRAFETRAPLLYLHAVRPGGFVPYYPVYVEADDQDQRQFLISLDPSLHFVKDPLNLDSDERSYAEKLVRTRLHQPLFRARVMRAYATTCSICHLKHADLLDAAHIIADSDANGMARVTNGLALCKIHHAAYDRNLLGITPDYEVRINRELLDEIDGPMLRHGLQDMHGQRLTLPKRASERPSRDSLARRFAEFSSTP
ncbi:HNH endonuclease [Agreia sp. PsM10]|uniref:HNH endonuclease n=1 Tax=Agreia sp. PsM10 TaxID=3030533 RepID=UPI00263A922F|nr:HNH endonuclease [Agreia sp. PsM10]MDN4641119.1 HNH endonuclease [Agreia sp. PsM10]